MKKSGSRDTVLLFIVLLLALGTICYLLVIKKNFDKLSSVKEELAAVEAEKAKNDAIIQQAQQLDEEREKLKTQIQTLENKFLPDLYTSAIQRKLYKHFEDAGIPFIVEISNTQPAYDVVNMTDGKTSPNRVMSSTYTISVSGTDGFLITHDEEDQMDLSYEVFYNQLLIGPGSNVANPEGAKYGVTNANDLKTSTYVGYEEFVKACEAIQADAPDYVKLNEISIEDKDVGFCYYTAKVDVYAYDLVSRLSAASTDMEYMKWVGAENIATGGLVGIPNYFLVTNPNLYHVPESSPLYGRYISFLSFDWATNRPFAAWSHWGYEWNNLDQIIKNGTKNPPEILRLTIQYQIGAITTEEYNRVYAELTKGQAAPITTETEDTNANTNTNANGRNS